MSRKVEDRVDPHPVAYVTGETAIQRGGVATLAVLGLALVSCSTSGHVPPSDDSGLHEVRVTAASAVHLSAPGSAGADVQAVVDQYCVGCHNDRRRIADLALTALDASDPGAHPEIWEKVVKKLRAGAMPPGGSPRPDPATYQTVIRWLEAELDQAWAADPNVGRVNAVHRLNRTEYNNAINDLLALDVDVRDQMPGDETMGGGFDNVADALTISPLHMERYMSVARVISRLATGLPPSGAGSARYRADDAKPQDVRMSEDLPFGSRGGMAIRHYFPVDGEYTISISLQKNYAGYARGMGWPQELDVRIDGHLARRFTVGGEARSYRPAPDSYAGAGDGPGWAGSPEWEDYLQVGAERELRVRVPVEAGQRVVGISFPRDLWMDEELLPQAPLQERSQIDYFNNDYLGLAGVLEVQIDGPFQIQGTATATRSRRHIFTCEPQAEAEEVACAREILSRIARRAYRRPLTTEDEQVILEFFEIGREQGETFDHGIQFALERILIDPDFLLRIYRDPTAEPRVTTEGRGTVRSAAAEFQEKGAPYPISDVELASRLSFFLWNSIPDETLLDLAEDGRLTDPRVLREQTLRMLADPRAHEALVESFATQWLKLRELDDRLLQDDIYLEYDHNLRDAMERETKLFIESTIREDRSVVELLSADYTYLNERLAQHYDIPEVVGSHFRRVTLPDLESRGGLLGHASLLTVTSYPERTTPVLRGKWLLETILGRHVPPPPPDLDTSLEEPEDDGSVRKASIRERLAKHRTVPSCASCHSVIDPLGFALESYDATGGYRTIDELGNPIDNTGIWPETGAEVRGLPGVRAILLEQEDRFVHTLTTKLMQYALAREVEYYDEPVIRKIIRDTEADRYRWSSIIMAIVESPQFLKRMPPTTPVRSSSLHEETGAQSDGLHHR